MKYRYFDKYRLLDVTKQVIAPDGTTHTLHQIQRLDGTVGGFIESEANLSQEGSCWVGVGGRVYGSAKVFDSAELSGDVSLYGQPDANLRITGNTSLNAGIHGIFVTAYNDEILSIQDNANIYGNVCIEHNVHIRANAIISGTCDQPISITGPTGRSLSSCWIEDNVKILDAAKINGALNIQEDTIIGNNVKVDSGCIIFGHAVLLDGSFKNAKIKDAIFLECAGMENHTDLEGNIVIADGHYHITSCQIKYDGPLIEYNGESFTRDLVSGQQYLSQKQLLQLFRDKQMEDYTYSKVFKKFDFRHEDREDIEEDDRDLL